MPLKYFKSHDPWGVMAQDEYSKLVFSGNLNVGRIFKDIIKKIEFKDTPVITFGDAVDVFQLFSPQARHAWNRSVLTVINQGNMQVGCIHLFLALSANPTIEILFQRVGTNLHDARKLLNNYMLLSPESSGFVEIKKVPFEAFAESEKLHSPNISPVMILIALMNTLPQDHILQAIFSNLGLTLTKLEVLAVWLLDLNYEFPKNSFASDLLHCCQKIRWIELHNKIQFKLDVVEQALVSADNDPQQALRWLVQASAIAQKHKLQTVSSLPAAPRPTDHAYLRRPDSKRFNFLAKP